MDGVDDLRETRAQIVLVTRHQGNFLVPFDHNQADAVELELINPVAGRWRMRLDILVSDFDKVVLEDDVELRRVP